MHVQVILFDGFDPLDVIAPYEVFHVGGSVSGSAVTAELVSAEGRREVPSGIGGLSLHATAALDPVRPGLVLVPGATGRVGTAQDERDGAQSGNQGNIPATLGRALATALPTLLKDAMAHPQITVTTVCGGSLVLAFAGLLDGRYATTHHLGMDMLDAAGAHAVHARVVDDGDLVTGAGVTSGLDLGLYLLEREIGPRIAHTVEGLFAHERRGVVWRDAGPTPASR